MARVRLDSAGIAELLQSSGVRKVVDSAADAVADNARGAAEVQRHGMRVLTDSGTSDRARAIVTIAHAGGLGVQGKHGTLTRAVSAAGLSAGKVGRG